MLYSELDIGVSGTLGKKKSAVKLPFVNDRIVRNVKRLVRSYSTDIRVLFCSGESLRKMLVSSAFGSSVCPCEERRGDGKKRGRPMVCCGCGAGFAHGN